MQSCKVYLLGYAPGPAMRGTLRCATLSRGMLTPASRLTSRKRAATRSRVRCATRPQSESRLACAASIPAPAAYASTTRIRSRLLLRLTHPNTARQCRAIKRSSLPSAWRSPVGSCAKQNPPPAPPISPARLRLSERNRRGATRHAAHTAAASARGTPKPARNPCRNATVEREPTPYAFLQIPLPAVA